MYFKVLSYFQRGWCFICFIFHQVIQFVTQLDPPSFQNIATLFSRGPPFTTGHVRVCPKCPKEVYVMRCHQCVPFLLQKMVGGISGIRGISKLPMYDVGDQGMQIYGRLEGYPLNSTFFGLMSYYLILVISDIPSTWPAFNPWVLNVNYLFFLVGCIPIYMGVSQNRGTPKWMVYNGKPY